jgi:hypothetical protein
VISDTWAALQGPRATAWISLLYATGVALTFDEFGFWITLNGGRGVRWNTTGLLLIAVVFAIATAGPAIHKAASIGEARPDGSESERILTNDEV